MLITCCKDRFSCPIRCDVQSQSAYEENSYLVGRIKDLENLIEEMVSSNQEVIDETANTTEDYKIRVSKAFNTTKPIICNRFMP